MGPDADAYDGWWGPCHTWPDMTCWSLALCRLIRECIRRPVQNVADPAGRLSEPHDGRRYLRTS